MVPQGNTFIINTSKPGWGDFTHWVCRFSRTGADCGAREVYNKSPVPIFVHVSVFKMSLDYRVTHPNGKNLKLTQS